MAEAFRACQSAIQEQIRLMWEEVVCAVCPVEPERLKVEVVCLFPFPTFTPTPTPTPTTHPFPSKASCSLLC